MRLSFAESLFQNQIRLSDFKTFLDLSPFLYQVFVRIDCLFVVAIALLSCMEDVAAML